MSDFLLELKNRLEGRLVVKVDKPNLMEHICKVTVKNEDGTFNAFEIGATELGAWITNSFVGDGEFDSLDALCLHYHDYSYRQEFGRKRLKILIDKNTLCCIAPDGKKFPVNISKLNTFEKSIVMHKKAKNLIKQMLGLGDMWKLVFTMRQGETDYDDLQLPEI